MTTVTNAITEYYEQIQMAAELCRREPWESASPPGFVPAFTLPPLDERFGAFFAASRLQVLDLGLHHDCQLRLLDLTCNPRTRTTKTFASLLMVARAVQHIRTTGDSILLVTPSSANKGGALRDAVSRAVECGLVEPEQLRIAVVVPRQGLSKLWSLPVSATARARALNPVFLAQTEDGRMVKSLTSRFTAEYSARIYERCRLRIWHTYHLDNYRMADAIRAFAEADLVGYPEPSGIRVHAQAVSSAFGLLGYHHGRRVLSEMLNRECGPHPRWLLVQHLGTPDLVLNHLFGSFSRDNLPAYVLDATSGLLTQSSVPSFPLKTSSLDETIDSTFYSHSPATAHIISDIQGRHGGAGIVVSLQECLERYDALRALLPAGGPVLPADPRELREWALVMVLTGVLCAIDRNLVPRGSEVMIHASGSYSTRDYVPLPREYTVAVSDIDDMFHVIEQSTASR